MRCNGPKLRFINWRIEMISMIFKVIMMITAMSFYSLSYAISPNSPPPRGDGVIINGVHEVLMELEQTSNPFTPVFQALSHNSTRPFYVYPDMGSMNKNFLTLPYFTDCNYQDGKAVNVNIMINAKGLNNISNDKINCSSLKDVVSTISSRYSTAIIMPMISGHADDIPVPSQDQTTQANNLFSALSQIGNSQLQGVSFDLESQSVNENQWAFFYALAQKFELTDNLKFIAIFDGEALKEKMASYNSNQQYHVKFILLHSAYDLSKQSSLKPESLSNYNDGITAFMNGNKTPNLYVQFILPASATDSNFEAAAIFNQKLLNKTIIPPKNIKKISNSINFDSNITNFMTLPILVIQKNNLPMSICNFANLKQFLSNQVYNITPSDYQNECVLDTQGTIYFQDNSNILYHDFCGDSSRQSPNEPPNTCPTSQASYMNQSLFNFHSNAKNKTLPYVLGVILYSMRPIGFWATTCSKNWFNLDLSDNSILKICTGFYPEIIRSDVIKSYKKNLPD